MSDALWNNEVLEEQDQKQNWGHQKKKTESLNRKKRVHYEFIEDYQEYLLKANYSISTIRPHKVRASYFISYYAKIAEISVNSIEDLKNLTMTEINLYEDYLMNRVSSKEIKDETAYSCIKNLRLFIKFLKHKGIIKFKYSH